jgi:hypothetical protein
VEGESSRYFWRFSEAYWSVLVTGLPENCALDLGSVRRFIEIALFNFSKGNELHEKEMADHYRRLASAIQKLIDSFDPALGHVARKCPDQIVEAQKKLLAEFEANEGADLWEHLIRVAELGTKGRLQEGKDYEDLLTYLSDMAGRAEKEALNFDELRRIRLRITLCSCLN